MKKALVLTGGDLLITKDLLNDIEYDYVVACDSGISNAIKHDVRVDLSIGDYDSIDDEGKKYIEDNNISVMEYPSQKDATDTELACELLMQQGYKKITIIGGIGSRLDHTMANAMLLKGLRENGIDARIISENNMVYYYSAGDEFRINKILKYLSFISIEKKGSVITSKGLKYELTNTLIPIHSSLGVSNEILDTFALIKIKSGEGFLMLSKDK